MPWRAKNATARRKNAIALLPGRPLLYNGQEVVTDPLVSLEYVDGSGDPELEIIAARTGEPVPPGA